MEILGAIVDISEELPVQTAWHLAAKSQALFLLYTLSKHFKAGNVIKNDHQI